MNNGYPFLSRREILARIASDPAFAIDCVAILQGRFEHRAEGGPSSGWMASHAAKATKLAARLASGEATAKEKSEAAELAARYSKQLARVFRDRELAARPELAATAMVFGIHAAEPSTVAPTTPSHEAKASPAAAASEPTPSPKKRGRPKGSKNRAKDEPKPARRRPRA
jgi:hypothetical protein